VDKPQKLKILMVEDEEFDRALVERELKRSIPNHEVLCVENPEDFIKALKNYRPELILCDYSLPRFSAIEALKLLSLHAPDVPAIIVTGTLTDETAVECLKLGAIDYVLKDKVVRLPTAIKHALDLRRSKDEKLEFERRLRQNERQLRTITEALPAFLAYFTSDLRVAFCNKISEKWFGLSEEEVAGREIESVMGSEISETIKTSIRNLKSGEVISFESLLPDHGVSRYVNITLKPEVDSDGEIQGFVCLMTDISERKRYEEELKSAKDTADTANQAKSQFLANMSHEMRTPLSVISGFIELLASPNTKPEDRIKYIEKVAKNSDRLRKMIDEILDLSKAEAGKLQVSSSEFPLATVFSQVKSLLLPLAQEKGLTLQFEVKGEIPAYVFTDQTMLRHILINIIGNAIKFSDVSPITITVQRDPKNEKSLQVSVKDLGHGLSPEQASHLFEPFMQADSSMTRRIGGTGLGLALAKRLAQALSGDVVLAETIVGKGSTFLITVDAGKPSNSDIIKSLDTVFHATSTASVDTSTQIRLDGFKVLLVDDAQEIRFLVTRFLETSGAEVDIAVNGEEAVAKALSGSHDLVLMDIQMPILDGYHATATLRSKGYKTPIIALTAHALKDERERCLKMGFSDFLTKPIKRLELLTNLKAHELKARAPN
jgi:two-component system, sensor histidine kinase